jgi:hypothetical protein
MTVVNIFDDDDSKDKTPVFDWQHGHFITPLCSHYENRAGGAERVNDVTMYAAGKASRHVPVEILFDRIKELHDHKGHLYVILWKPLGPVLEECFRQAWNDIGLECPTAVTFCLQGSEEADDMCL